MLICVNIVSAGYADRYVARTLPGADPRIWRAKPREKVNRAFAPVWYSFVDLSATIVGWHVRFELGRTPKKKIDLA